MRFIRSQSKRRSRCTFCRPFPLQVEQLEFRRLLSGQPVATAVDQLDFQTDDQGMWAASSQSLSASFRESVFTTPPAAIGTFGGFWDAPNPVRVIYDVAYEGCKLLLVEGLIADCQNGLGSRPPSTLESGFEVVYDVGLDFGFYGRVSVSAGEVDVVYPTQTTIEATGVNGILPGETFSINSSELPGAATMATKFANAEASFGVFVDAHVNASINAKILGATIVNESFGFDTNGEFRQELLGAKIDAGAGSLEARLFGVDLGFLVPGVEVSDPLGIVNASLFLPSLDTPPHSSFDGSVITNTQLPVTRPNNGASPIDFAKVGVGLDEIVTAVSGIAFSYSTPDNDNFQITAELLNAELAAFLGIGQTMTFDPKLMVDLTFDQPTMVETVPSSGQFSLVTSKRIEVGESVRAIHPGGDLNVGSSYTVDVNDFTNDTDILLSPAFIYSLLNFSVNGHVPDALNAATGIDLSLCVYCPDAVPLGDPVKVADLVSPTFAMQGFSDVTGGSLLLPAVEPPSLSLNPVTMINENGSAVLSGSISDLNTSETFTLDVNWGDPNSPGNTQQLALGTTPINAGGVTWNPDTRQFTVSHQYLDDNPTATPHDTYTITVEVTDCTNQTSGQHFPTVLVKNVIPAIDTVNVTPMIDENGTVTLTGTYSDTGTQDTHTIDVDWGPNETPSLGVPVSRGTFTLTHQYLDDNPTDSLSDIYTINVTLNDDDTGSDSTSIDTLVKNLAPHDVVINHLLISSYVLAVGEPVLFEGEFADVGTQDTHTAVWTFSHVVDLGPVGETRVGTVIQGSGTVADTFSFSGAGVYTVNLEVTDDDTDATSSSTATFVVYDPNDGFVTGGGWIDSPAGTYFSDETLTGKANFGFVSKYKKGANTPIGQTEFQFKMADLNFHSTSYEWLVVAGAHAKYKGSGTINGQGDYGFRLTAIDGGINGGGGVDKFRMKIWNKSDGTIVYDNQLNADDDDTPSTTLGGGQIMIHKGGKNVLVENGQSTATRGVLLTQTALAGLFDQAVDHWASQGSNAEQRNSLYALDVRIADFSGARLGMASSSTNVVWIDRDAAGYGWSTADGEPSGVDLLSTLTHELGHVLGLDHDVMGSTLEVGARVLPISVKKLPPSGDALGVSKATVVPDMSRYNIASPASHDSAFHSLDPTIDRLRLTEAALNHIRPPVGQSHARHQSLARRSFDNAFFSSKRKLGNLDGEMVDAVIEEGAWLC